MATYTTLLVVLISLVPAATPTDLPSKSQDLVVATEEMLRANYFTFVMLINMFPLDQRIQGNVTFLMPNDRTLSKITMPQNAVSDFLLRHSIPLPLLFDYLQHIPSGSTIPSSEPDYVLNVCNKGRKSYFLNNVKIISPNLCTAGSSIRCHGIDEVLADMHPSPSCPSSPSPAAVAAQPVPSIPSSDPSSLSPAPTAAAPPPDQEHRPRKSGSSQSKFLSRGDLLQMLAAVVLRLMVGLFI